MTTLVIIDGKKTYINGVESDLNDLNEDTMSDRLQDITKQIDDKQSMVDSLHEQRNDMIVHAYTKLGFSAIQLGQVLKVSRQRIYAILYKSEEE